MNGVNLATGVCTSIKMLLVLDLIISHNIDQTLMMKLLKLVAAFSYVIGCTAQCTTEQWFADTCAFGLDGECDTGFFCLDGSDCFDCDPCAAITDCEACTAAGCSYCGSPGLVTCYSSIVSDLLTNWCGDDFAVTEVGTCPQPDDSCDAIDTCEACTEAGCAFCQDRLGLFCRSKFYATQDPGFCSDFGGTPFQTEACLPPPCRTYDGLCEDCIDAGCSYCQDQFDLHCRSADFVDDNPEFCTMDGGTPFRNDVCVPPTCDIFSATSCEKCTLAGCSWCAGTGACTSVGEADIGCSATACTDQPSCDEFSYVSCESCTANGCLWNPSAGNCLHKVSCGDDCTASETCPANDNIFSDPLFDAHEWLFEMINLRTVWEAGITGSGVGIRINDSGVDSVNPEFSEKFDLASSCNEYEPVFGSSHGTVVAAIAAASGNNGACSVGIAPNAILSSCIATGIFPDSPVEGLNPAVFDGSLFLDRMENMAISQNSWNEDDCRAIGRRRLQACPFQSEGNPCEDAACVDLESTACADVIANYCFDSENYEKDVMGCNLYLDLYVECKYNGLTPETNAAFITGATEGRGGKGYIYVFASGNEYETGAHVNGEGLLHTRFVISVGAVGRDGKHSSFSTPGASLQVTAPGPDFEDDIGYTVTTPGGTCEPAGAGTSFAAPVVSGVIALMLEANPELSWRDVHGILAATSRQVDPDHPSWATNAAGIHHSILYGFGLVNAGAAVDAALSWNLYPLTEVSFMLDSGALELPIPAFEEGSVSSALAVSQNFIVENVAVYVNLRHSSRGDLKVLLTSPSGTVSLLHPGMRPENSQEEQLWKLTSVVSWGEESGGDWTLTLEDKKEGNLQDCIDLEWSLPFGNLVTLDCDTVASQGCDAFAARAEGGLADSAYVADSGNTPDVACCACGGGNVVSSVPDVFNSWRLVVYGRNLDEQTVTAPPSAAPITLAPTTSSPIMPAPIPVENTTPSPSTPAPSDAPTTTAPVPAPSTASPSDAPVTLAPTSSSPIMPAPIPVDITTPPPSSPAPSVAPITTAPVPAPAAAPSDAPSTTTPVSAPSTATPSNVPATSAPEQVATERCRTRA